MKKMRAAFLFICISNNFSMYSVTNAFRTLFQAGRGPFHFPLPRDTEKNWSIDIWSVGWGRCASQAFFSGPCDQDCGPFPCNTDDKVTTFASEEGMTALWFGKSSFRGEEIFAGGQQIVPNNPWMSFATMSPRFLYSETAVLNGVIYTQRFDDSKWVLELRAIVPYRSVAVERKICAGYKESFEDVMLEEMQVTSVNGAGNPTAADVSYAYRLDFLTSLQNNTQSVNNPMVVFGTPTTDTNIATIDVTLPANPSAYVVKQCGGTLPISPYAKQEGTATPLAVDGSGTGYKTYSFSSAPADYADNLGQSRAEQSTLWVVPVATGPVGSSPLAPGADVIPSAVNSVLLALEAQNRGSAEAFFASQGIDFCTTNATGVGDTDLECNAIYNISDDAFIRIETGATVVTDKLRTEWLGSMLYQSVSTAKRHFALTVGFEGAWRPCSWFAFRVNDRFTHWLNQVENRCAPFVGATVINIGAPTFDVIVGFDWNILHVDGTFFNPLNENMGVTLGYEFFAKTRERIKTNQTTAVDLLGATQPLDVSLLTKHTNTMTHRFRAEIFSRWDYVEIYGGFDEIFAGRHALKETTCHLGLKMEF